MQRRNVRSRRKISDYKENCFERWREERRSVDNYQRVNPVWRWMMRGKPRMQAIYCTFITAGMLEVYHYKHLYVRKGSPVKNVGYENSLVNRLKRKIRHFIVEAVRDVRNRLVKIGCLK